MYHDARFIVHATQGHDWRARAECAPCCEAIPNRARRIDLTNAAIAYHASLGYTENRALYGLAGNPR